MATSVGEREVVRENAADVAIAAPPRATGSTELPSLRSDGERLKIERDNAQLRADIVAITRAPLPWWQRGSIVATMTAIIAAVVPATTAVQAHYQKERDLALQASKQDHEIRTSYLDRLDKPGARLRTLRFVLATTGDITLRMWAQAEKREVEAEVAAIDRQIEALTHATQPAQSADPSASQLDTNAVPMPIGPQTPAGAIDSVQDKVGKLRELARLVEERKRASSLEPDNDAQRVGEYQAQIEELQKTVARLKAQRESERLKAQREIERLKDERESARKLSSRIPASDFLTPPLLPALPDE